MSLARRPLLHCEPSCKLSITLTNGALRDRYQAGEGLSFELTMEYGN